MSTHPFSYSVSQVPLSVRSLSSSLNDLNISPTAQRPRSPLGPSPWNMFENVGQAHVKRNVNSKINNLAGKLIANVKVAEQCVVVDGISPVRLLHWTASENSHSSGDDHYDTEDTNIVITKGGGVTRRKAPKRKAASLSLVVPGSESDISASTTSPKFSANLVDENMNNNNNSPVSGRKSGDQSRPHSRQDRVQVLPSKIGGFMSQHLPPATERISTSSQRNSYIQSRIASTSSSITSKKAEPQKSKALLNRMSRLMVAAAAKEKETSGVQQLLTSQTEANTISSGRSSSNYTTGVGESIHTNDRSKALKSRMSKLLLKAAAREKRNSPSQEIISSEPALRSSTSSSGTPDKADGVALQLPQNPTLSVHVSPRKSASKSKALKSRMAGLLIKAAAKEKNNSRTQDGYDHAHSSTSLPTIDQKKLSQISKSPIASAKERAACTKSVGKASISVQSKMDGVSHRESRSKILKSKMAGLLLKAAEQQKTVGNELVIPDGIRQRRLSCSSQRSELLVAQYTDSHAGLPVRAQEIKLAEGGLARSDAGQNLPHLSEQGTSRSYWEQLIPGEPPVKIILPTPKLQRKPKESGWTKLLVTMKLLKPKSKSSSVSSSPKIPRSGWQKLRYALRKKSMSVQKAKNEIEKLQLEHSTTTRIQYHPETPLENHQDFYLKTKSQTTSNTVYNQTHSTSRSLQHDPPTTRMDNDDLSVDFNSRTFQSKQASANVVSVSVPYPYNGSDNLIPGLSANKHIKKKASKRFVPAMSSEDPLTTLQKAKARLQKREQNSKQLTVPSIIPDPLPNMETNWLKLARSRLNKLPQSVDQADDTVPAESITPPSPHRGLTLPSSPIDVSPTKRNLYNASSILSNHIHASPAHSTADVSSPTRSSYILSNSSTPPSPWRRHPASGNWVLRKQSSSSLPPEEPQQPVCQEQGNLSDIEEDGGSNSICSSVADRAKRLLADMQRVSQPSQPNLTHPNPAFNKLLPKKYSLQQSRKIVQLSSNMVTPEVESYGNEQVTEKASITENSVKFLFRNSKTNRSIKENTSEISPEQSEKVCGPSLEDAAATASSELPSVVSASSHPYPYWMHSSPNLVPAFPFSTIPNTSAMLSPGQYMQDLTPSTRQQFAYGQVILVFLRCTPFEL